MRAIILAAGQGTRLRPLTDDKPKCMVELAGKPLLHHQVNALRGAGINDIVLVGGYRSDQLQADGTQLVLNPDYATTNMVGTLFCAEHLMTHDDDLLIAYGDIVYEQKVLRSLLDCDATVALSIDREWQRLWESRMDDPLSDAETLKLEDDNRIRELGKKPDSLEEIQGQYIGLIKVRSDFVAALRNFYHQLNRSAHYDGKDFDNMFMTSFIQALIDAGHEVRAAFTDNGWIEVDTVEDLEHYEAMHRANTLSRFVTLGK
ncbi:MAG: phosphocholine cytidylyltransferase family protein [Pseudomonadota bacterium]